MHAGRRFKLLDILMWTRREAFVFLVLALVPPALASLNVTVPHVPWQPILLLGTAVAFMTGFKSNAAYDRLWEARQIWGGIVNSSRAWTIMVRDFIVAPHGGADDAELDSVRARLVHRHCAWLTALRYQLREPRAWEKMHDKENVEFSRSHYRVPEWQTPLDDEITKYLSAEERTAILATKNRAVSVIAAQSAELRSLAARGYLTEFRHVELERMLTTLYDHQGRCERIKNFPYPRHFSTMNLIFIWLFIVALPYGVYTELTKASASLYWWSAPMSLIVAWVFHSMDKIGEVTENPFEGNANDVPISAMSRAIEIDMRQLIGETELPAALQPQHDILM